MLILAALLTPPCVHQLSSPSLFNTLATVANPRLLKRAQLWVK